MSTNLTAHPFGAGPVLPRHRVRPPEPAAKKPNVGPEERHTNRVYATLPIRVIGTDHMGISFVEDTTTVCINQNGARISLAHSLLLDDVVLIRNLKNLNEAEFHVVGIVQRAFGSRAEWGVELVHPNSNIWGAEFFAPPNQTLAKVWIECGACRKPAEVKLSAFQYDVLLATGLISRHCDRCFETTRWKPAEQEPAGLGEATEAEPGIPTASQRLTRRVRMAFRMRVRSEAGISEITKTRDVSRKGLCFESTQQFQTGKRAYVTIPYSDQATALEVPVEIRWVSKTNDHQLYGASYIKA
jgi:hypothetical protein